MAIVQMEEKGLSSEQAQIEAFYANTRRLNKQDVPAASAAGHHDGGYEQWENQLDL